jgi:hypothetical protein
MEEAKRLVEEIKEITIQYRAEVGRGRKPWPKAITTRIEKLADLGWKAPRIAAETGVPYFSILHWRSREKKKFHSMPVRPAAKLSEQKSLIVGKPDSATAAGYLPQVATATVAIMVTVTTPDGFLVKVEGLDAGVEILRRLRGSILCS